MKIYVRIRKEVYTGNWTHREEIDEVETSFSLQKIEGIINKEFETLKNDGTWEIDLKNKTAIQRDENSTKIIQHIIKTIEI